MESNSSRKSWLSFMWIVGGLFMKSFSGTGGYSSRAGRGRGVKKEGKWKRGKETEGKGRSEEGGRRGEGGGRRGEGKGRGEEGGKRGGRRGEGEGWGRSREEEENGMRERVRKLGGGRGEKRVYMCIYCMKFIFINVHQVSLKAEFEKRAYAHLHASLMFTWG